MKLKKKKILVFVIVIAVIILCGIFLPLYNGSGCSLSPEKSCWNRKMNLLEYFGDSENLDLAISLQNTLPPLPKFPDIIGNFRFDVYYHHVSTECEDFVRQKVCSNITHARYINDSTNEQVELTFVRGITGKEALVANKDRYFTPDKLEGYKIGWIGYGSKRFTWFPQKDIDIIIVSEGTLKYNKDKDELPEYSDKTTGTSLVSVYFLGKYPPNN